MNARIFLTDDHLRLESRKGVSISKNSVYNIQNNPLYDGYFANVGFMKESYEDSRAKYAALKVSGLEEEGVGAYLMTNYSTSAPQSRTQAMQNQQALIREMVADLGSLRLNSCRAWSLTDGVRLTGLEGTSYLSILDESVPFYTIALHGLVDYNSGNYMDFYEPRAQLLDAVAAGGNVSFTLSHEGTAKLKNADSASYYSTEYALWRDEVLEVWQELYPYLTATQGRFIEGYETLAKGVTLTGYEGGVQVLVNNTDQPFVWQNAEVAPRAFLVQKGGK